MKKKLIPTINISSIIKQDFNSKKSIETIYKIKKACIEVGFFQIVGHGIDKKDINNIIKVGNNFFNSSNKNKMKLAPKKWNKYNKNVYRGYFPNDVNGKEGLDIGDLRVKKIFAKKLKNQFVEYIELNKSMCTRVYDLTRGDSEPLPQFSEWDGERLKTAEYLSLYPNVLLGIQADHFFVILLLSEAVDQTRERLQFYYADSDGIGDSYRERRENLHAAWSVVFSEDISVVEGMQRGRASPAFDGGLFTPLMDVPTHHFHQWLLSRLKKNTTRAVSR